MKTIAILLLGAASACAADGWISLFDGKTLKGWVDPRAKTPAGDAWTVEDGCIKAVAKPRFREDLFSAETFGDFELEFEWKIGQTGNSGVKYRIQDHFIVLPREQGEPFEKSVERTLRSKRLPRQPGEDYVIGFEYQVAGRGNSDAMSDPRRTAGSLYGVAAPSRDAARPEGEFNTARIVLRGNRVEHWMNGAKIVDAALDGPEALESFHRRWAPAPAVEQMLAKQPRKACPISLQNHNDEAWFRNIRIRKLN